MWVPGVVTPARDALAIYRFLTFSTFVLHAFKLPPLRPLRLEHLEQIAARGVRVGRSDVN